MIRVALRTRLELAPETLQDFELAAEEKYWQGCELLSLGHAAGGIYLLGYTAEMVLKYASFRAQGHRPGTPLAGLFGPVRQWMRVRNPLIDRENYHSLMFWMNYLRGKRRERGAALPADIDAELVRRVRRVYSVWWVEMRYRPDQAQPAEVAVMYDDVTWLRSRRVLLWS